MTLKEELGKLATSTKEKTTEKIVGEIIRKIVEKKGEISYQIIMLLTKEKMERGYSKEYTLKELQEKLPWKKSTTIVRLQEAVKEGILKHEKKRYKLNKENEIVKRIWNYYHETSKQGDEKRREIWQLAQRKNELEKKIAEKKEREGKYKKLTKKEDKEFQEEINRKISDAFEPKEIMQEYLQENKIRVLGYKEN